MTDNIVPLHRLSIDIEAFEKNDLVNKHSFTFDDTQTGLFKTTNGDEYSYQLSQDLFIDKIIKG